ncbi:50S ribosomal protein L6 [Candidatus Geothermarchaeota archaeon]|nr:MAG: 50S ribosomal protein L6 [Candidatus Geothermarchaeota archaeon]
MSIKTKEKAEERITKRKVHYGEVEVPEGIKVALEGDNVLVVSGPLGTVRKNFSKVPVEFKLEPSKISYAIYWKGKKGYALINTIKCILENLFIGVSKGFTYRMKIYYRHFPITVEVNGKTVLIKNFLGERGVRKAKIVGDTKVKVQKDDVIVYGISKEDVGLTVANIMAACRIKEKDPRVFQDGIYLYSKEVGMEVG